MMQLLRDEYGSVTEMLKVRKTLETYLPRRRVQPA
jgi:hypothetical protein